MQQNIENSLRDMEVGSYQTLDRRSRKGESNWGTQREGVQKVSNSGGKKKIVILMLLREFLKQSYDSKVTFAHYVFAPRTLITYDWNFRFYYALLAGLTSTSWVEGMKMSCSGKIIRLTQV